MVDNFRLLRHSHTHTNNPPTVDVKVDADNNK